MKLVTYDVIAPFISNNFLISFVVNIPKEAVWTGEAIKALDARPIGFGGMGDLNRALREDDPRHYVFREYAYAERRLRQHRNVIDTDRLYDRVWQVNRKSGNSINVAISNEYDLTADEVRTVHDRYAPVSVIFHTNGMGRITKEAHEAADELDIEIIDSDGLPELLRR